MGAIASQITSASIVCWGADHRKHQSSASLAFMRGIHRWPVDSSHKGPVTRKLFPCDDFFMVHEFLTSSASLNTVRRGQEPWPRFDLQTLFPGIGIPIIKIRRSWDRLIYMVGIPILIRYLYIETVSRAIKHDLDQYDRMCASLTRDGLIRSWEVFLEFPVALRDNDNEMLSISHCSHYSDVIMSASSRWFVQPFVHAQIK